MKRKIAVLGGIKSPRLGIIGRTSAMHYKNTAKRSDEIGRELGVEYLVVTSRRRIGGRDLITAQPSPFLMAVVYVGLEDNDRAFAWLEKALETRAWQLPMLKADVIFDDLRADARFSALLARIGLPN